MKKHLISLFIFCILVGTPAILSAQNLLIDSLKTVLQQEDISSHQRIMTMSDLADVISGSERSHAMQLNKKAIVLAQKHKDANGLTFTWSQQAVLQAMAGNKKLAKQAIDSALFYAREASPLMHGIVLYRKGYIQNLHNQPDDAFRSWRKALLYLSEPKGALYQAGIFYLKYGIYAERGELEKAADYAHLALKRATQSDDATMLVAAWQINGSSYLNRFFQTNKTALLDSAVYAFKQSIQLFRKKEGWIKSPGVVALSALNLANIYLDYYPAGYRDSVISNVNLALRVSIESGNKLMEINGYQVISRLYRRTDNLDAAEKALLKGRKLVESLDPPIYSVGKNIYRLLAQVNEQQGDSAAALKYYKQYLYYYRQMFDAKQYRTIQQLEAKYQAEKKEAALKQLKQRNAFQRKQTRLYITIAIIAILGLLGLFLAYRFRLKYSLQREKSKDEEAARLLAEQKLMQQQKEQMQTELMAGALQVEHKNELLENLKDKLQKKAGARPAKQLGRIIDDELRMDESFEDIRLQLNELHPEFFDRLQEKADKKLTKLDLKYCAYLSMKLSTKQIARLMSVEPKSVRMAKYRLKQKLELGKEDDIDDYLQSKGK